MQGLAACCDAVGVHPAVKKAIDEAVAQGVSQGLTWLLLALWVTNRARGSLDAAVTSTLQSHAHHVSTDLLDRSRDLFDRLLGKYRTDSWGRSRTQRLAAALGNL